MNLIRVAKANDAQLPFKTSTLYHWWHRKKYPHIFVKVGSNALFVDVDALNELLESMRGGKGNGAR